MRIDVNMIDILFKAKRADNGEWVYGYLSSDHTISVITPCGNWDEIVIDKSTVCQYTGLEDKNKNKVFKCDILKIAKRMDSLDLYYFPPLDYPCNVLVKWDRCAWSWETIRKEKYFIHFPDAWCHYECEVVGNMYDNPELLYD